MSLWVPDREGWDRVARALRAAPFFGWDTETHGHDVTETTPVRRAKVHVWSVAVPTPRLHPRGFMVAAARVLPLEALLYPPLRECLEDPALLKVAHNAPHDEHSVANHGVTVRGGHDALPRARVTWPDLGRYDAKTVAREKLGRTDVKDFKEVLAWHEEYALKVLVCVCGTPACRRRSKGHEKGWGESIRTRPALAPVESVVPGHPLWEGFVKYAAADALIACEEWDMMNRLRPTALPDLPWTPEVEWSRVS